MALTSRGDMSGPEPGLLSIAQGRRDQPVSRYFFELTTSPNVIWVYLAKINIKAGAPVMPLDPDNIDLAGNVSAKFKRARNAPF